MTYEEKRAQLDPASRRNMEQFAEFISRMIKKYGPEVLKELDEKEKEKPVTEK